MSGMAHSGREDLWSLLRVTLHIMQLRKLLPIFTHLHQLSTFLHKFASIPPALCKKPQLSQILCGRITFYSVHGRDCLGQEFYLHELVREYTSETIYNIDRSAKESNHYPSPPHESEITAGLHDRLTPQGCLLSKGEFQTATKPGSETRGHRRHICPPPMTIIRLGLPA